MTIDYLQTSVDMHTHKVSKERVDEMLSLLKVYELRCIIDDCREHGRAFGPLAEACRAELAKRGEQA
jgi:hypothetical protein